MRIETRRLEDATIAFLLGLLLGNIMGAYIVLDVLFWEHIR